MENLTSFMSGGSTELVKDRLKLVLTPLKNELEIILKEEFNSNSFFASVNVINTAVKANKALTYAYSLTGKVGEGKLNSILSFSLTTIKEHETAINDYKNSLTVSDVIQDVLGTGYEMGRSTISDFIDWWER